MPGEAPAAGVGDDSGAIAILDVVRPGVCLTIQDLGRWGWAALGVSPSGAMDRLAHAVANRLLGNPPGAAGLEVTGPGCELAFLADTRCALAGADLGAELDGQGLPPCWVGEVRANARLRFPARRRGARAAVAVSGGLAVPLMLGSAASDPGGGLGEPPLRAGARLAATGTGRPTGAAGEGAGVPDLARAYAALWDGWRVPVELRFVPVAEPDAQMASALRIAPDHVYRVSAQSNRVGFRFDGPALPVAHDPARISEPTAPGTIQIPGDGRPILLMADRNTTGGYAKLGYLATVDAWRAAQLWPGDAVRFRPIPEGEAIALYRSRKEAR